MKKFFPYIVITSLVFSTLACSITFNPPRVTTGQTVTFSVSEALPTGVEVAQLDLEMGAGTLELSGGAEDLIEGEIRYNISEWEPDLIRSANGFSIRQRNLENIRISTDDIVNEWNLRLGQFPIDLTISAGAYKGILDFTGVPLTNLSISDGASQATVRFDQPNTVEMDRLRYRTGASEVTLEGLANANAANLMFEGGAGSYTLDFSGNLQRNMNVNITAGVSSVKVIVPEGVSTRVSISGGLTNVQPRGTWRISNNVYESTGSGPLIDITLSMGLGNLELITK
jgi:hypothetical protein